ncbi:MAG: citrate/2-methylcitrate synthase, partial [Streptosporangiaceae bacterium]
LVSLAGADDPAFGADGRATGSDAPAAGSDDPAAGLDDGAGLGIAARLTAQQPVLLAAVLAARAGAPLPVPDPGAGLAAGFLLQLTGREPSPRAAEIFDSCLVVQADHMMAASTFAARVCAATLADMRTAVVAGLAALSGRLHGGANEQVMRGLEAARASARDVKGDPVDVAAELVTARLRGGADLSCQPVTGFGHRAYRGADPRAGVLRELSAELAAGGDDTYHRMATRIADIVLAECGLHPNADFYAATTYHYLGIPAGLATAVLSVARMAGWTAHIIEQQADNRLIRPVGEYIGETGLTWTPLAGR